MPATAWSIPARIETERLVLRRYEASDAEQMSRVTLASKEHLVPWMPWASAEPLSSEDRAGLIERFMREFDEGTDFVMGIFTREGDYVGGTGLHTRRGPGVLEIGYWIAADAQGKGYATEATQALAFIALGFAKAEHVEILHHPDNARSRRVPERCGFTYEGDEVVSLDGIGELEPVSVWSLKWADIAQPPLAWVARPVPRDAKGTPLAWQE